MSDITFFRIVDWDEKFENHRSREIKSCSWVKTPNNHDTDGFSYIITLPSGLAVYGAWQMLLQVASKCPRRGDLVSDNFKPYDLEMISRKTRCSLDGLTSAMPHLLQVEWVEEVTLDGAGYRATCARSRVLGAESRKEGKGTEGKEEEERNGMEENEVNGKNGSAPDIASVRAALSSYSWPKADRDDLIKAMQRYGWKGETCEKMLCAARKVMVLSPETEKAKYVVMSVRNDDFDAGDLERSRQHLKDYSAKASNGTHS